MYAIHVASLEINYNYLIFNKTIEGLRARRAYIAFLADFHFLQDQANFWQTDLF